MSCASLLGLVAWMSSTFFSHFNSNIYQSSTHHITANSRPFERFTENFTGTLSWQQNLEAYFTSFIELYSSELVFIWFIGVLLFGIKWTGAFYYTFSLKNNNTRLVPLKWQNKVKQLSYNLGINKEINILESAKVDVPMVIGYLKPVILIPTSAFTGFTADQLEAVIVHELAHIKNNDFLINMILSGLEVILFYHPAYWFIYKIIMQERENHCDDIAVAHIGNPRLYAETLFNMEKIRQQHSLAMALQGNKNQLLERIKRICIVPNQQFKGGFNKSGIAMGFLFILAIISLAKVPLDAKETIFIPLKEEIKEAFTNPVEIEELEEEKEIIIAEEKNEITPLEGDEYFIAKMKEHQQKAFQSEFHPPLNELINPLPSRLKFLVLTEEDRLENKVIHPILNNINLFDSIPDSEKITLTIVSEVDKKGTTTLTYYKEGKVSKRIFIKKNKAKYKLNGIKQDMGNRTFKLRKGDQFSIKGTMQIYTVSDDDKKFSLTGDVIEYDDGVGGDFEVKNGTLFNQGNEVETITGEKEVEKEHKEIEKEYLKMEQLHHQAEMEHEEDMKKHEKDMERHEEDMRRHEEDMERHEKDMERHEKERVKDDKFQNILIKELLADKLIKNKKKVDFNLTDGKLKINGKRVHDKYHTKYIQLYEKFYGRKMEKSSSYRYQRR